MAKAAKPAARARNAGRNKLVAARKPAGRAKAQARAKPVARAKVVAKPKAAARPAARPKVPAPAKKVVAKKVVAPKIAAPAPARRLVNEWDSVIGLDPGITKAYRSLVEKTKKHKALSPKLREFMHIATDAAVTHLHGPAIRLHIAKALKAGATKAEILEVLQLASVLGVHGVIMGARVLTEELGGAEAIDAKATPQMKKRAEAIKEGFVAARGTWSPSWETILRVSPDFLDGYKDYSGHPWANGVLDKKVKEFIYIAIDASTTHLYENGTRVHIRNALKYGATPDEIMEVVEITALAGFETCTVGVAMLAEELDRMTE